MTYSRFQMRRSLTPGQIPTGLLEGELAFNIPDARWWIGRTDGSNLELTSAGSSYTLPQATSSTLGGVKVGGNITASAGVLSLTQANIIAALAYTPYNASNPSGYINSAGAPVQSVAGRVGTIVLSNADITAALGYTPYNSTNPSGFITSSSAGLVTSVFGRTGTVVLANTDINTALGFTPYSAANPSNFIAAAGAPVQSVAGRTGAVVLNNSDINTALGYTPYNASNPAGYITSSSAGLVTSVFGRTGTVVLANTDVNTALGFTPYNAANPAGFINSAGAPVQSVAGRTGIVTLTGSDITTALAYTPYNSTNPSGYIAAGGAPVQSVAGRIGAVVLTNADIVTALGFTPIAVAGAPVQSVAGRTGAVVLSGADITTALTYTPYNATNPSGFITTTGAPVQSVAGRTGAITLAGPDITTGLITPARMGSSPLATSFLRGDNTWATPSQVQAALNAISPGTGIPAESADKTVVTTVGPVIVDSFGITYALTSGGQITEQQPNTTVVVTDGVTSGVSLLLYYGHFLYQQNTSGNWYKRANNASIGNGTTGVDNYVASSDPRVGTIGTRPASQPWRIADLLEIVGSNIYFAPSGSSTSQDGGDGTISGITACFQYICAGTGMGMFHRLYANDPTNQANGCHALAVAMPGTAFTICMDVLGAPTSTLQANVLSLAQLSQQSATAFPVICVEGINEPDHDFGGGTLSAAAARAEQQTLYNAIHPLGLKVAAPGLSEEGGISGPGFFNTYWGSELAAVNAACDFANDHDYPNNGTPSSDITYRTDGVSAGFGNKQVIVTEFDAVKYQGGSFVTSEAAQAYWTCLMMVTAYVNHPVYAGLNIWPLYSYPGFVSTGTIATPVGIFTTGSSSPRWVAMMMKAFWTLTTDLNATKRSFTPTAFSYTVSTLAGNEGQACFQNSSGTNFILMWQDSNTISGTANNRTITFTGATKPSSVLAYSLTFVKTAAPAVRATGTPGGAVTSIVIPLRSEVVLVVCKP